MEPKLGNVFEQETEDDPPRKHPLEKNPMEFV